MVFFPNFSKLVRKNTPIKNILFDLDRKFLHIINFQYMICFIEKKLIKINYYFYFKKAMKYGIYFTFIVE